MTRFAPPTTHRLADREAESVRREHERKILELQGAPAVQLQVLAEVTLEDGVPTPIAHNLGRAPRWMRESCVRGAATAGLVQEVRDARYDPTRFVVLIATGFGARITCSVAVL